MPRLARGPHRHEHDHGDNHGPSSTGHSGFGELTAMKNQLETAGGRRADRRGATGLALNSWTRGQVVEVLKQLSQAAAHAEESRPDKSWIARPARSKGPWDRTLTLERRADRGHRPQDGRRQAQTEPTILKLFGTTDYDPATVTVVRTQFDSRVDKVLVDLGIDRQEGRPAARAVQHRPGRGQEQLRGRRSASGPTTRRCSITRPRWPRTTASPARS